MYLESNKDFDEEFDTIHTKLEQMETPDNFEKIYDFAKRFFKKYGFSVKAVEMVYLLGYIKKDKTDSK